MTKRDDPIQSALTLLDRARAAGLSLRLRRAGLAVRPGNRLDPNMERELRMAYDGICAALVAEKAARVAIQSARHRATTEGVV